MFGYSVKTKTKSIIYDKELFRIRVSDLLIYNMLNPIFVGGGLIAPPVWKTSSGDVSFDFCDPKT